MGFSSTARVIALATQVLRPSAPIPVRARSSASCRRRGRGSDDGAILDHDVSTVKRLRIGARLRRSVDEDPSVPIVVACKRSARNRGTGRATTVKGPKSARSCRSADSPWRQRQGLAAKGGSARGDQVVDKGVARERSPIGDQNSVALAGEQHRSRRVPHCPITIASYSFVMEPSPVCDAVTMARTAPDGSVSPLDAGFGRLLTYAPLRLGAQAEHNRYCRRGARGSTG
jgi:hypothetical protein